jgi:hypothetical protein
MHLEVCGHHAMVELGEVDNALLGRGLVAQRTLAVVPKHVTHCAAFSSVQKRNKIYKLEVNPKYVLLKSSAKNDSASVL